KDDTWRVTPLSMLAAFSQLTNGGKAISPHLLQGLWRIDSNSFQPTAFKATEGVGAEASANFVSFVKTLLPPGPGDDLIIESIRSAAKETSVEQVLPLAGETSNLTEDTFRFSSTTLASGSQQNEHHLALLLVVDGAKISLSLPSPFRKAAAEIIVQADGLMAKRWANEIKPPKLDSDALLHQKWSLSQSLDTPRPVLETLVEQEMPELIGLSLRKAMQAMQGYTVKINVRGTGRVVRQSPAAGSPLKGVSETTLELQMDN
ncbi:MAG: PASTA domain-containing protein, partial [Desulfobulbaceae bacterium]|nr:PASTA domain-containing protein [Desulfobulbaceae bacterium]